MTGVGQFTDSSKFMKLNKLGISYIVIDFINNGL